MQERQSPRHANGGLTDPKPGTKGVCCRAPSTGPCPMWLRRPRFVQPSRWILRIGHDGFPKHPGFERSKAGPCESPWGRGLAARPNQGQQQGKEGSSHRVGVKDFLQGRGEVPSESDSCATKMKHLEQHEFDSHVGHGGGVFVHGVSSVGQSSPEAIVDGGGFRRGPNAAVARRHRQLVLRRQLTHTLTDLQGRFLRPAETTDCPGPCAVTVRFVGYVSQTLDCNALPV